MFTNLLLPNDGSALSGLATPLAIRLAHVFRAKLHIVRVHYRMPASPDSAAPVNLDETLRDIEREKLDGLVDQAVSAGVSASAELLEGPVISALERYIHAASIDFVVMATHGRSGIKRALLGSVAEGLLRRTETPALLLHAWSDEDEVRTGLADLKRIVVALDGSPESEAIMPIATALARVCSAELILMQAAVPVFEVASAMVPEVLYDEQNALAEQATSYLRSLAARQSASLAIRCVVVSASTVTEAILRCAHNEEADIIAISTHGRRGLARFAFGSIAESVLRGSDIPVLLLPHAQADSARMTASIPAG